MTTARMITAEGMELAHISATIGYLEMVERDTGADFGDRLVTLRTRRDELLEMIHEPGTEAAG